MTKHLSEEQERELCERFDSDPREDNGHEAAGVSRNYKRVQDGIRSLHVPKIDADALSRRLAKEMGYRGGRLEGWRRLTGWVPRPVLVSICLVCAVVGVAAVTDFLFFSCPVTGVKLAAQSPTASERVPFLWEHRLQHGRIVAVPEGITAELRLSDGSTIFCAPETQIAVRMGTNRRLTLRSGEIIVHATHVPNSALTVETPLGSVAVAGTVFRVKIFR